MVVLVLCCCLKCPALLVDLHAAHSSAALTTVAEALHKHCTDEDLYLQLALFVLLLFAAAAAVIETFNTAAAAAALLSLGSAIFATCLPHSTAVTTATTNTEQLEHQQACPEQVGAKQEVGVAAAP